MVTNMHTYMKKILSFLSYHNAVPAVLIMLVLGAGSAFAAGQGMPPPVTSLPASDNSAPESVDASSLLAANLGAFDFHPTVTAVVETDLLYTISYSILTLAPGDGEWTVVSKTGEFSVAKDTLGDGGLNTYVAQKLHDIENGERSYLARAQAAEKALVDAREAQPASAFAALVGLALDQIPVPIVEKPAPEPQPQVTPPAQLIPTPAEVVVSTSTPEEDTPAPEEATSTSESTATSTEQTAQPTENSDATSTPESIATSTPESN